MKTSLRRWRGFSLHKHGGDIKDRRDLRPLAQLDELAQASQDMQDMRDCYDGLLSVAAATASSAYEFSESLQEMGACLLEITALNDNEESGKVLLMLGKIQFELQKLVDSYRSHIFQTITIPSESLLNELQTVEEMKRQCEEKRNVYDYMVMRQREKGRSKSGKGETFSMQQLQEARDEYDQEATLFVFRLKSLKKGQSRSLLTQAARHHAAQLSFFKKAVKSLEALEPQVKMVTEKQHIDYQFRGLEDDDIEDGDNDDNGSDSHADGELSFDYGQNDQEQDSVSPSKKSVEADVTFPLVATVETAKKDLDGSSRNSLSFGRAIRKSSQSAPFFSENKSDLADRRKQMRPSSAWKLSTYVLPTPGDTKSPHSIGAGNPVPHTLKTSLTGRAYNLWHSSPLDPTKFDKSLGDEKQMLPSSAWKLNTYVLPTPGDTKSPHSTGSGSPVPRTLKTSLSGQAFYLWHSSPLDPTKFGKSLGDEKISRATAPSVLIESNNNTVSSQLPPPLGDGFSFSWPEARGASDSKKVKRQAFSGPILRNPMPQPPSSPKVSPSASPTFKSSPEISELHELPRPPARLTLNSSRPMGMVGHSAPLLPKGEVLSAAGKSVKSNAASPLPKPPQAVTRSFSIPSSSHKLVAAQNLEMPSPPLSPISIPNNNQSSAGSEPIVQSVEFRGNSEQSDLVSLISSTVSPKQNMAGVDIHVGNGFVG